MAVLYVTDFTSIGNDGFANPISSAALPYNQTQTVAIGASSAQTTNAISNNSRVVRLHSDAICSFAVGSNPTATATSPRLAANQTEYFWVPINSGIKVAVITNT